MKLSKYAFWIDGSDDRKILYSSLNGLIIVFTDQQKKIKIDHLFEEKKISYDENDELINLLYKKNILLDEETDERILVRYLYEQKVVRSKKLELMLIVTRQCNFRCIYCAQEHVDLKMSQSTYDNIYLWIKKLVEHKEINEVEISFFWWGTIIRI